MEPNPTQENHHHHHHHHHAIFLPLPLQGHINPSIQLALTLASRGFTITFLLLEDIHHELTQARTSTRPGLSSGDPFEGVRAGPDPVDIRYRFVSDGLPLDFDRKGRLEEYLEWYLNGGMYAIMEDAVGEVVSGSNPRPDVLIADTFFPWASKVAKKWGLKYASFWTEIALVFSVYYHMPLLREHGHFDCPDTREDPIEYIPGVKSIDPKDLSSYLQDKDTSTNMHKILNAAYEDVKSADHVLCNTIEHLEPDTISALQPSCPFTQSGRLSTQDRPKGLGP